MKQQQYAHQHLVCVALNINIKFDLCEQQSGVPFRLLCATASPPVQVVEANGSPDWPSHGN